MFESLERREDRRPPVGFAAAPHGGFSRHPCDPPQHREREPHAADPDHDQRCARHTIEGNRATSAPAWSSRSRCRRRRLYDRLVWVAFDPPPVHRCPTYFGPDRRFKIEGYPTGVGRRARRQDHPGRGRDRPDLEQDDIDSLFQRRTSRTVRMTEKTLANDRMFSVKTRFQELAQRPGGVPRDIALRQGRQPNRRRRRAGFVDWVDRELQDLAQALRKAQAGRPTTAQIDAIAAHAANCATSEPPWGSP